MDIKKIIPIFFALIIAVTFLYFWFWRPDFFQKKQEKNNTQTTVIEEKVDMVKLENDYKTEVKRIFGEYLKLQENPNARDIAALKQELLNLKTSIEFKALHLNLVLAITKFESFLQNGVEEERDDSEKMIRGIQEKYPWLN